MKLELNVKRFNNEDVIATFSNLMATGSCYKFEDCNHSGDLDAGDKFIGYTDGIIYLENDTIDADFAQLFNCWLVNANTSLEFGKIYRKYSDEDSVTYLYECKDSSHTHGTN